MLLNASKTESMNARQDARVNKDFFADWTVRYITTVFHVGCYLGYCWRFTVGSEQALQSNKKAFTEINMFRQHIYCIPIEKIIRGAQPYYVNTQMRMKNPWGELNLGHWGGGNWKIIFHF
jgi:hypothetical protein